MKFITPQQWHHELHVEYAHTVQVCVDDDHMQHLKMHNWLVTHVGEPYVTWIYVFPTYRFRSESDAVKFSLVWS